MHPGPSTSLSSPPQTAERGVVATASWREWAAVGLLQLVVELISVRPMLLANQAAGVTPALQHVAIAASADFSLWLLLTPVAFAALDQFPLVRKRLVPHIVGWAVLGIAVAAAQAWMAREVWIAASAWSTAARRTLSSPLLAFPYLFESNLAPVLVLGLAYVILQRMHHSRRDRARAAWLEHAAVEARLRAAAAQLEPHFLFNTLNAIAGLVRVDTVAAESMLVRLGDLLRLTFNNGPRASVSLSAELHRLDLYLSIQQMRFGDRLTVRKAIDPASLSAQVPAFVLQPLVENALLHGVAPRRGPASVEITAERMADSLRLSIVDDGVGLPTNTVVSERVGLGSTRARLAAMYPGAYSLDVRPAWPRGTQVMVTVPFVRLEPTATDAMRGEDAAKGPVSSR